MEELFSLLQKLEELEKEEELREAAGLYDSEPVSDPVCNSKNMNSISHKLPSVWECVNIVLAYTLSGINSNCLLYFLTDCLLFYYISGRIRL